MAEQLKTDKNGQHFADYEKVGRKKTDSKKATKKVVTTKK